MSLGLALVLAAQEELTLAYKHAKGESREVHSDVVLELVIDGSDTAVTYMKMAAEFLSFQKIHEVAQGTLTVKSVDDKGAAKIKIRNKTASYDGTYDDQPFRYAFKYPGGNPGDADKMGQALWGMGAEQLEASVDARGAFKELKAQQDSTDEALGYIQYLEPRLPRGGKVVVGKEWTAKWNGTREDDEKRGTIAYRQTCKVERVESVAGRATAVISMALEGELKLKPEIAKKYADTRTDAGQTVEAKGTAWFDIEAGRVRRTEFDGQVRTYFDGPDPDNAARYELNFAFKAKGSRELR